MKVIAAIDEKRTSDAAFAEAIQVARERDAELFVLGVIAPRFDAPQPAYGERVRRFRQTEFAVARAVALAREGGLAAEGALRFGKVRSAALAEAIRHDVKHVFLAGVRRPFSARTGRVEHIILPPAAPHVGELESLAA